MQNLLGAALRQRPVRAAVEHQPIDHVQITVAETEGVGDRWPYYDEYGALRDMLQNHCCSCSAWSPWSRRPTSTPNAMRNEKVKVLRSLRPLTGDDVTAHRARPVRAPAWSTASRCAATEEEAENASGTETFVALKVGDRQLALGRRALLSCAPASACRSGTPRSSSSSSPCRIRSSAGSDGTPEPNRLVIELQPDEEMHAELIAKEPGPGGMRLRPVCAGAELHPERSSAAHPTPTSGC